MNHVVDMLKLLAAFLLICLFSSCENHSNHVVYDEDTLDLPGFVYVRSAGKSVVLGKSESSAPLKERTEMTAEFTYDFYIGKNEVTCTDYNKFAQRFGTVSPCEGELHPATSMNFNDVVLYANAMSKLNDMDTVYTYYSVKYDEMGHCVEMEGLRFHPEAEGFRLPTEAEWVYVARQGWNTHNSWTSDVSEYYVHPVCSQPSNYLGVCDMSGNVAEWVNDWLGYFKDTTVLNYIGSTDGGTFGEKVIKGGSVVNESKNISYLSRLDVYPVTAISKAPYVGFRLAYGKIPDATSLSFDGSASVGNASPVAKANSVKEYTGSFYTKLAFRNGASGNLAFMDYSRGGNTIKEIVDTMEVFHPDISPDGLWVAFCTAMEGVDKKSELYVRKLDESGEGLVKLDVESAAIPRWRILSTGDTVVVYVTRAADNAQSSKFFAESTWQVKFSNGRFGEPEKLFDGAYHGGISDDNTLAVSGSTRLRARVAETGSSAMEQGSDVIWYNEEQACNVSLSRGNSKQTLFLDFASSTGKDFVGSRYTAHKMLFFANEIGLLTGYLSAPDGFTYDHTEWVVGDTSTVEEWSGLFVSALTNKEGNHSRIILQSRTGEYITLVEGDELWHPCVWIKPNVLEYEDILLQTDSAGVYYDFYAEASEITMKVKMRMFWDMKDSIELFAVGSSRTECGFAPLEMSSYKSFNFGYAGNELWGELYLVENYILNHGKNMKVLVLELPLDLQSNSPNVKNQNVFEQAPGYIYDKNHDFWKDGLPEYFISLVDENLPYSESEESTYVETMGLAKAESAGWKGNELKRDSIFSSEEMGYYNDVMDYLDEFIEKTADSSFKIVLVIFPQSPLYASTGSFGRYGVPRSTAMKTIAHYQKLAEKYPHLVVMDENKMGEHEYTDDMALDYDHLSEAGALHFTEKLDSLLKAWE